MTPQQKDAIATCLISQKYKAGATIINEGDMANSYHLIKSGKVNCIKNGQVVTQLGATDTFGEAALFEQGIRHLTIKSDEPSVVLGVSRSSLAECLGAKVREIIEANQIRWVSNRDDMMCNLTKLQIEKWIKYSRISTYENGDVIVRKGKNEHLFCVFLEGQAKYGGTDYKKDSVFGKTEFVSLDESSKGYARLT